MYTFEITTGQESKKMAIRLFLIGLFSLTQINLGAKIGISEFFCCLIGPFLFCNKYGIFKRDGVVLFFWLLIFWAIAALISDYVNGSYIQQIIRGFTVPVTIFSVSVCIYYNLRQSSDGLKWLLLGIACSSVLSIFIFQRGAAGDLAAEGDMGAAIDRVVGYKLFWAKMITTWMTLPICIAYLKVPRFYAISVMIGLSIFNLLTGGRSMFLSAVMSLILIFLGGKKMTTMQILKRWFPMIILILILIVALSKVVYQYAVQKGYLGEEELDKYTSQTQKGSDVISMIMSGRSEFFVAVIAALDKPLIGHGSQPFDVFGYVGEFLSRYGTDEEIAKYKRSNIKANGAFFIIPSHSHVVCYWMWHGVTALLFWLYILYMVITTIRKRMHYVPCWYGYLAIVLPAFIWDYLFSPLGERVNECTLFCVLLLLQKIDKKQRISLY